MSVKRCKECGFLPCRCEDLGELYRGASMGQANTPSCWPMCSDALAVHPDQVAEANDRARRHGIAVEYRRDGMAVIADRAARKKLLRLEGLHDRNGGFGD